MISYEILIGGLEHLDYFSIILGISSSQLTLTPSFFRGVGQLNHQPDQPVPFSQPQISLTPKHAWTEFRDPRFLLRKTTHRTTSQ